MLEIQGKNLKFTRGDDIRFMIRLTGRELPEGTTALFSCKETVWEPAVPTIEKELEVADGMVSVILENYETDIPAGQYYWDLRIREPAADGGTYIHTPMEYGTIKVVEGVGEA